MQAGVDLVDGGDDDVVGAGDVSVGVHDGVVDPSQDRLLVLPVNLANSNHQSSRLCLT